MPTVIPSLGPSVSVFPKSLVRHASSSGVKEVPDSPVGRLGTMRGIAAVAVVIVAVAVVFQLLGASLRGRVVAILDVFLCVRLQG